MRPIHKKLIAGSLGALAALILAEGGVRLLSRITGLEATTKYFVTDGGFSVPINQADPWLMWRTRPLASFRGIHINSRGFRGKEFVETKETGTCRIVAMGDSCTLGVGVPEGETYSVVLEHLLAGKGGRCKKFEVINAGVAGYSTLQGLRYFQQDILKYRPDLITLYFGLNDYVYASPLRDRDRSAQRPWMTRFDALLGHSQLYRALRARGQAWLARRNEIPPPRRVELVEFQRNLASIVSAAREAGCAVLLLNLPLRPEIPLVVNPIPVIKNGALVEWLRPGFIGGSDYYVKGSFIGPTKYLEDAVSRYPEWAMAHYLLAKRYQEEGSAARAEKEFQRARETDRDRKTVSDYNEAISGIAREYGVPLVDLVQAFRDSAASGLFLDERHPSPEGHRVIAQSIMDTMDEAKFLE